MAGKRFWRGAAAGILCAALFLMPFSGVSAESTDVGTDFNAVSGSVVYADKTVSGLAEKRLLQYWSLIPENITDAMEEAGIRVYLSRTYDFSEEGTVTYAVTKGASVTYSGKSLEAVSVSLPVIYFDADYGVGHADALVHEAGHVLDWLLYLEGAETYSEDAERPSESDEWASIYESCRYLLAAQDPAGAANTLSSSSEGFAEAFKLYVISPGTLESISGGAFLFIEKCVGSL